MPKFDYIFGAEQMKKDERWSSDFDAKLLHEAHQLVVPSLQFRNDKNESLEDRWIAGEKLTGIKRFAAFSHEDNNPSDWISMISGQIYPDGKIVILNTATAESKRRAGNLTALICEFCGENVKLNCEKRKESSENAVTLIGSCISTGVNASSFADQNNVRKAIAKVCSDYINVVDITDEKAKKYGDSFGKIVQSLKDSANDESLTEDMRKSMKNIYDSLPMEPKHNVTYAAKVAQSISSVEDKLHVKQGASAKASEQHKKVTPELYVATSGNLNFSINANADEELVDIVQQHPELFNKKGLCLNVDFMQQKGLECSKYAQARNKAYKKYESKAQGQGPSVSM